MKCIVRTVNDHGNVYECLAFVCPGCIEFGGTGLHMLSIDANKHSPSWDWDRNLERPTLNPSIMTGRDTAFVCHSYLRAGIFEFLEDCTHSLKGQHIQMPDLPEWFIQEEVD